MGVEELIRRMNAGDREAIMEVGRRLTSGDTEVAVALGRWLTADAGAADGAGDDPDALEAELLAVAEATTQSPAATGARIEALQARARGCHNVLALGLGVDRLRLMGQLPGARETLERAKRLRNCRECELDTLRREALLLLYEGDAEGALRVSQEAMDGYEVLGGSGHDLNGNGWASSLIVRAEIRSRLGDNVGAASDFACALDQYRPGSKVWQVTHQNLASTLSHCGPAEKARADKMLRPLRLSMRRGESVDRAAFLWLDGQLKVAADPRRKSRGLLRLKTALDLYACPTISMPDPWLGVVSDCTRARYPDRDAIALFLLENVFEIVPRTAPAASTTIHHTPMAAKLRLRPNVARLIKADVHRQQLVELRHLCTTRRMEPASSLRRAIEGLREATAAPCLLPPWPVVGVR